jgi:hypothetical protein
MTLDPRIEKTNGIDLCLLLMKKGNAIQQLSPNTRWGIVSIAF